jgi:cyclophilin family peptidyl-prolyl cis-trans isomerase
VIGSAFLMTAARSPLFLRLLRLLAALPVFGGTLAAADVPTANGLYAVLETTKGPIVCELFFQGAPLTSMNFTGLAEGTIGNTFRKPGEPFFDGLTFHRVVKDFVVQGGDPKGDGEGGPGYSFTDEFSPQLRHDRAGMLSMANDGPNTNGSQFFITLRDTNRLNYLHSVFGRVVSGMEVVERIEQGDKIDHVKIVRIGDAAKKFQTDVIAFEIYKKRALLLPDPIVPPDFKYLIDESKTLPDFRVKNFNFKLANYDKFRRERIVVRILATATSSKTDLSVLAKQFEAGASRGVLICYFAADDTWKIVGGKRLQGALPVGKAAETAVPEREVDALLNRSRELTKEKKLKEAVDAAIDTVMLKLDDVPPAHP